MKFFKKRIKEQYPPLTVEEDVTLCSRKRHEAFMIAKSDFVLGRDDILSQVSATIVITSANEAGRLFLILFVCLCVSSVSRITVKVIIRFH